MPVYEVETGGVLASVETYCRHLCGPAGFDSDTQPSRDEVNRFISMAYYRVATQLAIHLFSPVQTEEDVLGFLQSLNAIETVIAIELSYPVGGDGAANARFKEFTSQRDDMYVFMEGPGLSDLGATVIGGASGGLSFTGTSIARKNEVVGDTDLVPSRFRKDQFKSRGVNLSDQSQP